MLEDGIEKIDASAFIEFRKLKSVTLPASIKFVGRNAFRCADDTRFTLPKTLSENTLRSRKEIDILGEQKWEEAQAQKAEKARQKDEQRLLAAAEKARQDSIAAEERRVEEIRKAEEAKQKEAAQLAEKKRKEEEALKARQARETEEARKREEAEIARKAELARKAERDSIAEVQRQIAAAEKARQDSIAAEERRAEELRKAEEARQKEEARLAEKKRKEEEALQAKLAREAEKLRKEEEKRIAEEARKAEERRKAEEKRIAEEARKAEERRKFVEDSIAEAERKAEIARLEQMRILQEEEKKRLFDVDQNIPPGLITNPNTYCAIIANEKYRAPNIEDVKFAANDGEVFRQYCLKTLGIRGNNIRFYENATGGDFDSAVGFLIDAARANKGNAQLILYYSGHGMPSEENQRAYLLPTDASAKSQRAWRSLSEVYTALGNTQAKSITVFLDACFSGRTRSNQAMLDTRSVAMRVMDEPLKGNMVVFSAASNAETAMPFVEKKHGMFTYFLLNQLSTAKGNINYGELFKNVEADVMKYSFDMNGKIQTPTVTTSPTMKDSWQQLKF